MYAQRNDEGLGLAVTTLTSLASGLFAKNKDAGRYSSNLKAYNAAIAGAPFSADGFPDPMSFLLGKSPVKYGGGGGWANVGPQEDAWKKYNDAKARLASGGVQQYPNAASTGAAGAPLGGPVVAGVSVGPLAIAGIAAAGIYMLSRKR